jgi:O-antigen/teichoic acid export membrane protein
MIPRSKQNQEHSLLQGTVWMLIAYGIRLVAQGISYVFLVRLLGSEQFGAFTAAFALATLLSPIAEMGSYSLAVRDAASKQDVSKTVGKSLVVIALCFPLCVLIAIFIKPLLLAKISWLVVMSIVVAVCLGGSLNRLALGVHVGKQMLDRNAALETMNGLLQLAWVGLLYLIGATVEVWGLLFLGHYLLMAAVSLNWVTRTWGRPHLVFTGLREQVHFGRHFALASMSHFGTSESDKMLLAHYSTLNATGTYGAAQRLIGVAFFPLQAFLGATYSQFFQAGIDDGILGTRALVRRFLPFVAGYGVLMWGIMYFGAGILGSLLGAGYTDTTTALRLLSPIILLQGCQFLMADALTGGGLQKIRSSMLFAALVSGILINLVLVPMLGWRGAALTNLIIQSLLTCALFVFIFTGTRESNFYRKAQ